MGLTRNSQGVAVKTAKRISFTHRNNPKNPGAQEFQEPGQQQKK